MEVARLAEAGGVGVKEAAQAALDDPDPKALDTFLTRGQHQARLEDYRVEAARLAEGGTPELTAAAEVALASPDTHLITFITAGQHKAIRRDLLNAAHVEQVQGIIAKAAESAARAYKSAYDAAAAAETAQGHADTAAGHAAKATDSAQEADDHAKRAKEAANRAEASARSAADSATDARNTEAKAASSARKARHAAISAEASYGAAQGYAARAFQAAEQARQSALNAGESASEAYIKHRSTVTRYQTERYSAEQQALLDQKLAEHETTLRQDEQAAGSSEALTLLQSLIGNDVPAGMSLKDFIHLRLDGLGLIPGLGEPADAANCIAYGVETGLNKYGIGEKDAWKDALLSCASMAPIACWLAAPFKGARWSDKYGGAVGEIFETIGNLFNKSPCGRRNSFPAGTAVLMADGSAKPIEQVMVGDMVRATDPISGITGARQVEATIYTPDGRDFTDIRLAPAAGGGLLTATANHPFWSVNTRSWAVAADLHEGDTLRSPNGSPVKIREIRHWKGLQAAYNLTVSDLHTYYVLAGTKPVLVHNSGGDSPAFETIPSKLRKLSDSEIKNWVGDAHEFKTEALKDAGARDRVIAHYDIYVDKRTGYLFLMPKELPTSCDEMCSGGRLAREPEAARCVEGGEQVAAVASAALASTGLPPESHARMPAGRRARHERELLGHPNGEGAPSIPT
ncbi:polymorphic toxin-type HINT domain-containing protein [Streptomyces sp. NPDC056525]|uniref:polymorphic toxin-type HINT domain-containing protein n=1 Tax=unclassified Streptomyces TaxID=2593676 RepID=UPI0036BDB2AC